MKILGHTLQFTICHNGEYMFQTVCITVLLLTSYSALWSHVIKQAMFARSFSFQTMQRQDDVGGRGVDVMLIREP